MMSRKHSHSDLAVPPGEYLEEVISNLGMTKNELARRMNRPATKLSAIFNGDKAITPDTALQLEKTVGVPAHVWTGLEAEFRLTLARNQEIGEMQRLQSESNLITKFCYSELVKLGFVTKKSKATEKVQELQRFMGVTSLKSISELKRYQVAFRQGAGKRSPEATSAWLRIGELEGQRAQCKPFKKSVLENALPDIRGMTRLLPEKFEAPLRQILLDAGVVFVLCPHLPKTYLHGGTFWLGQNKAVLMLTNRGNWSDIYWFSLFHEIGHLLLHGKQMVFLEQSNKEQISSKFESEADQFAANILIAQKDLDIFLNKKPIYQKDIIAFAHHLKIDPGIIIGRLQHDRYFKNSWHNQLRSRYMWKNK